MRNWKVGTHGIKSWALLVLLGAAHQAMTQDAANPPNGVQVSVQSGSY